MKQKMRRQYHKREPLGEAKKPREVRMATVQPAVGNHSNC